MATFPTYARMLVDGSSEEFEPSIERTEMERGVPKQRLGNSQVLMTFNVNLVFMSRDDVNAFESWYFDEIKRIGWFTFTHPKNGQQISGRFKSGLGPLVPIVGQFHFATRTVAIEYLR